MYCSKKKKAKSKYEGITSIAVAALKRRSKKVKTYLELEAKVQEETKFNEKNSSSSNVVTDASRNENREIFVQPCDAISSDTDEAQHQKDRNFEQSFAECIRHKQLVKSCYIPIIRLAQNKISGLPSSHDSCLLRSEVSSSVPCSYTIHNHSEGCCSSFKTEEASCGKSSLVKQCRKKFSDSLSSTMSAESFARNDKTQVSCSLYEPVSDQSALPNLKHEEKMENLSSEVSFILQGKKLNMKHKLSKLYEFNSTEKPNNAEIMVVKSVDLNSVSTGNCENDRLDKETICRNSNFSSDVSDTFDNTRDYQYEIDADVSSSGDDDEEYRFLINPDISDFTGDILYIDHSSNPNITCTAKCFEHMEVISTDKLISCVKNCQKLAKETSDKKLNIYSLSEKHSQALFQQYLTSDHEDSLSQNACSPFFYGKQADVFETIKVFLGKNAYHNPRLEVLLKFDDQSQVYNVFNKKNVIKAEGNKSSLESRKKYVSSKNLKNDEKNCEKTWLNIEKCFNNKINNLEVSSLQLLKASEINHIALEHVEKEVVGNTGLEINSENSKKYLNANSKTDSSSDFLISKNQDDLNEEVDESLQLNDNDHLSDRNNHDSIGDLNEEEIDETLSIIAPSPEHLFDSSESDDDKDLSFKRYSQKEILPAVSTSDHGTIISKTKLNYQHDHTTYSLEVVNEPLAVSINNDTAVESALVNNAQKENHKNCDFDIAIRHNLCRSFLQKGHCSRPMCRYRHSNPTCEEIYSKEKAVKFLSKLKEHCDDGILGKAFEEAHSQFPDHSLPVKCKALIMLLHTSVKLNNISLIKDAFSLAKQFEVYNSDLCSSFIINCKNHSNLVSDSILELFGFCKIKKIKLSKEALFTLLNMFHYDLRHLIAVMKFMCCVNKTYIPQQLLSQCLLSMKNEPQLISQMNDLLIELPNEQFSQIELIAIEDFISLLEKYNHASEALKCRTRISHNNQIFTTNLISTNPYENKTIQLIKHCINNKRWRRLMEIFNEYGIGKKDGMVIQVIHSCFCSQMDNLGERFRSFIQEITVYGRELSVSYRFLLGQMGTALMLEAHSSKEFKAAFEVLETLHWYNINYYELQNLALPQLQTSRSSTICIPPWIIVTPSRVALVATDICLELNKPEEALQVLKDCHWAVPSDKLVDEVRKNELVWRAQLLMKLSLLLHHKKLYLEGANVLKMLLESLQHDLNDAVIRDSMTTDLDEIYNRSLEELLNAKNIEMALSLYKYFKFLGSVLYVRPTIWRAFIVSCMANGLKDQAEQIFDRCILMGTYKINMPNSSSYPTCLKLPTYLTKEEISLILSHFVEKMFTFLPSNQQKAEFEEIFSLSIILEEKKFEGYDTRCCSIPNNPANIEKTRKIVLHILQEVMKPPFDISPNSKTDAIYIEPMSLYQHFIFWKKFHPDTYKHDDTATAISNGSNMAVIPNSLRKTEAFRTSIASSQYTGFGLECSSISDDVSNKSTSILPFISNNKSFQTSLFSNDGEPSTNNNHSRISAKGFSGGSLEPCERQFHTSETKNSRISFFNENKDDNLIADSNAELSFSVFPSRKQRLNTKLNTAIKRHKPNVLWNKKIYQGNISQLKKKRLPQKKRKRQTNIFHNKNKYQTNISQNKSKVEANEISKMSGSFSDFKNIKMCISVDSCSVRTVTNSKSKDSEKQSSEDCTIKNYPLSSQSGPFIVETECEKYDRIRSEIPEMEILPSLSPTDIDKVCTTGKEDNSFKSNDSGHVISNNLAAAAEQKSEKQQDISESPKSYPITTVVSKTNHSRLNAYDGLDFQPQSIPVRQNSIARKPARFLHPQSLISSRPPRYHSNTNVFYHRRPHIQGSKNSYLSADLSNINDNHLQKQGFQESEAVNKIQHFLKCQVLYKHNSLKSTECEARVSYLTNRFLSQCGDLIDTLDKRTMKKLTEFAAANV